ncbi:DUF1294 domain-containing protein [Intestinimonas massiliensis (ex Afouda et al. 2020)]|uniref:DUF1294 domain-containing protein n=1 Tax=Intestinimonas massiliensis (ex Afouda et al. 2020) TaxID=1673721 RepID=UPI001F5FA5D2|nr:DUF1294 domain-containing protein [Intestinimonas massiliensis (ex Afouda et al. 2020)]
MMKWIGLWILLLSMADYVLMGVDKWKARRGTWRVPEKTFFLVAILGGTPGAILGMWTFHHKTRHWYFKWGLPAILVAQVALGIWLFQMWNGRL